MEHLDPPPPIAIRDAEQAALTRLRALGHDGVARAPYDDQGVRLLAEGAVAHVDVQAERVDLPTLRHIEGVAAAEGHAAYVFAAGGFTDEAVIWAGTSGVGLFVLDHAGGTQAVGRHAAAAVSASLASAEPATTGEYADIVEVAALLTDGLVGTPLFWIGLWDSTVGLALELWPEPGDRTTPACVTLELGAEPSGRLPEGWSAEDRPVAPETTERVWVRRCVHANQPPRVVAGEAVAHAVEALAIAGVDFERCRIEVRESTKPVDPHAEAALAPDPVLGTTRAWDHAEPLEPAKPATILSTVAARGRDAGGRAQAEGFDTEGRRAWWLEVVPSRGLLGGGRWQVEVRVPGDLLTPDEPRRLLHAAVASVGTARWRLDDDEWHLSEPAPSAEAGAQQAVAELSAAYAAGGADLEATSIRM